MTGLRSSRKDAVSTLWLIGAVCLIVGALWWLLPSQAVSDPSDTPDQPQDQPCVQHGLMYRGLPECDGVAGPDEGRVA